MGPFLLLPLYIVKATNQTHQETTTFYGHLRKETIGEDYASRIYKKALHLIGPAVSVLDIH